MREDGKKQELEWVFERISQIIAEHMNVNYQLILFGSRARNDYNARSDIDIGIISDTRIKPGIMFAMRDELDIIPTLLNIDLVDFGTVSKEFRQVALRNYRELAI